MAFMPHSPVLAVVAIYFVTSAPRVAAMLAQQTR
jgi:hypothetical protein